MVVAYLSEDSCTELFRFANLSDAVLELTFSKYPVSTSGQI